MTNELYIWAAGILDGESHMRTTNNIRKPDYPRIHIGMTHLKTIERIQAVFGKGEIKIQCKRGRQRNAAWRWECNGEDARYVLSLVRPHLFTKAEDAGYVLMLSDPTARLSLEEKEPLRRRLRLLNSRYVFDKDGDQGGTAEALPI